MVKLLIFRSILIVISTLYIICVSKIYYMAIFEKLWFLPIFFREIAQKPKNQPNFWFFDQIFFCLRAKIFLYIRWTHALEVKIFSHRVQKTSLLRCLEAPLWFSAYHPSYNLVIQSRGLGSKNSVWSRWFYLTSYHALRIDRRSERCLA